jgi:hypothetical protein
MMGQQIGITSVARRFRRLAIALLGFGFTGSSGMVDGNRAHADEVVVVCPQRFVAAIAPWIDYRRQQGMSVCRIDTAHDAEALRSAICRAADGSTRYVLLVGDAPVFGTPCDVQCQVPMGYVPTKVTAAWGSTPTLSSDLLYGDFDGDQVPDAAVGRLPVDSTEQLERLIARIRAQEASEDFGSWRSEVQLVGGVGGFGPLADHAIESVTRTIVTSVLPAEARTCVCYASPGHLFYPAGDSFTDAVLSRYQRGARFFVYAGHGQVTELDRVPATFDGKPVLDAQSVRRMARPAESAPIAIMLACYTGAMDASEDSIAEEMLLCEGGPIAVLAGSRVTMPYGNTTAAVGLIDGVFHQQLPRLGDAWHCALKQMHQEVSEDTSSARLMIDALAKVVSPPGTNLVEERREHMHLYNLIGDPTLQLHQPQEISIKVAPGHDRLTPIKMEIQSPISGALRICLDRPLGSVTSGDPNETTATCFEMQVTEGVMVSPSIRLPDDISGPIVVRAMVSGDRAWATGAAKTIVR